jgi:TonB family protein
MIRRLLVAVGVVAMARAAETPLTGFYIVSEFFSDNGAQFYYRILEVSPHGNGSVVKYVRIAPTNVFCPRQVIQAAEQTVVGRSPADLVGQDNPCAVKPAELNTVLRKYPGNEAAFETISFGIVAQCGDSSVSLALPISEKVDFRQLKLSHPRLAALWDLAGQVAEAAFGKDDIFHGRTEADDLELQRAGGKLLPQVTSGRYDEGLAAAVLGSGREWKKPTFASLLAGYRGPISQAEAKASYVPHLLNPSAYHFAHFVTPEYPLLAKHARIQGLVQLQLTVLPATGEITEVSSTSGHALLTPSAIEAAKNWRFEPNSAGTSSVKATIEYALQCAAPE